MKITMLLLFKQAILDIVNRKQNKKLPEMLTGQKQRLNI